MELLFGEQMLWDSLWSLSCVLLARLFLALACEAYNEGFSHFSVGVRLYTLTRRLLKWESCRKMLVGCLQGKRSLCLWWLWISGKVHHHHYHYLHHHHQNNSKHWVEHYAKYPQRIVTFNLHHTLCSYYYPCLTDQKTTAQGISCLPHMRVIIISWPSMSALMDRSFEEIFSERKMEGNS